jgi:hypothetical protein
LYLEYNKKQFYKLRYKWKELNKEYTELKEIADKIGLAFVDYVYNFTKDNDLPNPFDAEMGEDKNNRGSVVDITSSSESKSLFRKIMLKTHPDKKENNSSDLYVEATKAKKENNLQKLLDVGKKLNLNLKEISRDQLDVLESNISHLKQKIQNIKNSYAWVWFHGSQNRRHEVVYAFLNSIEYKEN